mmetsp:Transcript_16559/g.52819  ORF Transcript_16559/g.52819 Transcript_16559/m.52819 type:complete len:304 (+) Transcript_16559:3288-4199(+)
MRSCCDVTIIHDTVASPASALGHIPCGTGWTWMHAYLPLRPPPRSGVTTPARAGNVDGAGSTTRTPELQSTTGSPLPPSLNSDVATEWVEPTGGCSAILAWGRGAARVRPPSPPPPAAPASLFRRGSSEYGELSLTSRSASLAATPGAPGAVCPASAVVSTLPRRYAGAAPGPSCAIVGSVALIAAVLTPRPRSLSSAAATRSTATRSAAVSADTRFRPTKCGASAGSTPNARASPLSSASGSSLNATTLCRQAASSGYPSDSPPTSSMPCATLTGCRVKASRGDMRSLGGGASRTCSSAARL